MIFLIVRHNKMRISELFMQLISVYSGMWEILTSFKLSELNETNYKMYLRFVLNYGHFTFTFKFYSQNVYKLDNSIQLTPSNLLYDLCCVEKKCFSDLSVILILKKIKPVIKNVILFSSQLMLVRLSNKKQKQPRKKTPTQIVEPLSNN